MKLFSLLFSWTAIIFSIVALVGWAPYTAEGGVLTIVSICVTLIVGVSVVDSLTVFHLNRKLSELERQMRELNTLKEGIVNNRKDADEKLTRAEQGIYISWGVSLFNKEPIAAFEQFQKAFKLALPEPRYMDAAKKAIEFMEQVVPEIEAQIRNDKKTYGTILKLRIPNDVPEDIKVLPYYHLFEARIERIYKAIAALYQ